MGEFTNGDTPEQMAQNDLSQASTNTGEKEDGGFETSIDGCSADDMRNNMPIFNVSKGEFYQNMNYGRKRLRFKSGTSAQSYMAKTRYNKPFWIRDIETNYIRKVK